MSRRRVGNPLALAVLACLYEAPMHPYEMASTMRQRHKDESIKLNYGSLYTVVQGLERHKLIAPLEVRREGNRPERTVFAITDAGRLELIDWLSELISMPVHEFTQFEAGLSLLPVLPPEEAVKLLRERVTRIELELAQGAALRDFVGKRDLPRLYWIEGDLRWHLRRAELDFVNTMIADIESGGFDGLTQWRRFHGESVGEILSLEDAKAGLSKGRSRDAKA